MFVGLNYLIIKLITLITIIDLNLFDILLLLYYMLNIV